MCVRPKPVLYRCRDCHWEKTVAPRGDALGPGDYYQRCPVCGSLDLERTAVGDFQGGIVSLITRVLQGVKRSD
jgi:hypothetical protein